MPSWWGKHKKQANAENQDAVNGGSVHYYAKESEPDLLSQFPPEEHLRIITDEDVRVMNPKIKLMFNKRDGILQSLEGKTIQITALTIDIVDSSLKVKMISPNQTGEFYQKFIESTSDLIQNYGGYVLKNVGDCVIGFFPCSSYIVENQEKAILCGLAMTDMLNLLNKDFAKMKLPAIECRMSADIGPVQVLRVRSKDGYSVIDLFGSAINMATKISHYAKPNQMVIGDNLFWRIIDKDMFEFRVVRSWGLVEKYIYPVYIVERK